MKLLTTFKDQLIGILSGDPEFTSCDPAGLLRALWGPGGPLSNLSLKTCCREVEAKASEKGGLLAGVIGATVEPWTHVELASCHDLEQSRSHARSLLVVRPGAAASLECPERPFAASAHMLRRLTRNSRAPAPMAAAPLEARQVRDARLLPAARAREPRFFERLRHAAFP